MHGNGGITQSRSSSKVSQAKPLLSSDGWWMSMPSDHPYYSKVEAIAKNIKRGEEEALQGMKFYDRAKRAIAKAAELGLRLSGYTAAQILKHKNKRSKLMKELRLLVEGLIKKIVLYKDVKALENLEHTTRMQEALELHEKEVMLPISSRTTKIQPPKQTNVVNKQSVLASKNTNEVDFKNRYDPEEGPAPRKRPYEAAEMSGMSHGNIFPGPKTGAILTPFYHNLTPEDLKMRVPGIKAPRTQPPKQTNVVNKQSVLGVKNIREVDFKNRYEDEKDNTMDALDPLTRFNAARKIFSSDGEFLKKNTNVDAGPRSKRIPAEYYHHEDGDNGYTSASNASEEMVIDGHNHGLIKELELATEKRLASQNSVRIEDNPIDRLDPDDRYYESRKIFGGEKDFYNLGEKFRNGLSTRKLLSLLADKDAKDLTPEDLKMRVPGIKAPRTQPPKQTNVVNKQSVLGVKNIREVDFKNRYEDEKDNTMDALDPLTRFNAARKIFSSDGEFLKKNTNVDAGPRSKRIPAEYYHHEDGDNGYTSASNASEEMVIDGHNHGLIKELELATEKRLASQNSVRIEDNPIDRLDPDDRYSAARRFLNQKLQQNKSLTSKRSGIPY